MVNDSFANDSLTMLCIWSRNPPIYDVDSSDEHKDSCSSRKD